MNNRETKILAIQIGQQITIIRKKRKIQQTEFARRLSMQQPNLSRLEHGRTIPSLTTLVRVFDELNVRVEIRLIDLL